MGRDRPGPHFAERHGAPTRLPEVPLRGGVISGRYGPSGCQRLPCRRPEISPQHLLRPCRDAETARVELGSQEIMSACGGGGTIHGEHRVGADKRRYNTLNPLPPALLAMARVRRSFSIRPPRNPAKVFRRHLDGGPERLGAGPLRPPGERRPGTHSPCASLLLRPPPGERWQSFLREPSREKAGDGSHGEFRPPPPSPRAATRPRPP